MTYSQYGYRQGLTAPVFGTRATPPQMALYECWTPLIPGQGAKALLRAPDSFQARKTYAQAHPGMEVTDVCARRLVGCDLQSASDVATAEAGS